MFKRIGFALLAFTACTDGTGRDDNLGVETDELVFDKGYLWSKDDLTVCWEDSAFDDPATTQLDDVYAGPRSWVQSIVTANWSRLTRLELKGWARCSQTTNPDIRVGNGIVTTSYSHIGNTSVGRAPSMVLNLGCVVPTGCYDPTPGDIEGPGDIQDGFLAMCNGYLVNGQAPPNKRVCVETLGLHEFGHAIGLRHEHAHPDSTCSFHENLAGPDDFGTAHDGAAFGPFDAASIMSYCTALPAMRGETHPTISDGDVAKINQLYPSPPMLFTQPSVGGGPTLFGPGTFTVTGATAASTRSLYAPPGYTVKLCGTGGCWNLTGLVKTLPTAIDHNVTSVTVTTQAVGYTETGLRGTSAWYPPGKYLATSGTLKLPNDQLSSMWTPHGLAMRVCRHEGAAPGYLGLECAPIIRGTPTTDRTPSVTLPTGFDNTTSFIEVTAFVQLYGGSDFRGGDRGWFVPATYKASSGWNFTNVQSWLVPQTLELTVCTGEGTGSGTGCQVVPSGNIPPALNGQIKLIKVRELPVYVPPGCGAAC